MLSSVSNALAVLEYLAEAGEAGVSEIGRELGITVGTTHRLVATLVGAGFAEQNPDNRRYRPSSKLLTLANLMRGRESMREVAHERLTQLMKQANETTNLAVLNKHMVHYIDKVTSEQPFGIEARVGSRLPAYCTALGKVLLAGLDDADLEVYLEEMEDMASSDGSYPRPIAVEKFRKELDSVRERGVGEDHGEYLPDVYCAAAPVYNSDGQVVAAMSVSAPRSRFEARRDELVADLLNTANELSRDMQRFGAQDVTS